MFILRRISGDGVEMNFALGDSYTLVHSERNPQEFKRTASERAEGGKPLLMDSNTIAFVSNQNGMLYHIFKGQHSFIMTDTGATFARIHNPDWEGAVSVDAPVLS